MHRIHGYLWSVDELPVLSEHFGSLVCATFRIQRWGCQTYMSLASQNAQSSRVMQTTLRLGQTRTVQEQIASKLHLRLCWPRLHN